ncbi:MAG: sugar ABC transporter ATP-binding protein [Oscillospiraceae bacterium]|jgi:simple sugar transport system ATP-binding protein|nr:sugar ABC transporter ATP-binding protein [Oscillospiraceae bacterium]
MATANEYVLEMRGITKEYGQTTVLKDVSLAVRPGEIHALLGENGAGKSTLMNVLFGMPVIHETGGFKGDVLLDGQSTQILSPQQAMEKGIGMVHQEFMLIPGFTIAENIKLNREIARPNWISRALGKSLESLDMRAMAKDARTALDNVGMGIEEYTLVQGLPIGYMQFVEIAREIDKTGVKLLVFDEPTAVLTESEADQLVQVMKNIAASGIAIIFITHRLDEVMAAADHITILRDGRLAATRAVGETSLAELAELMIGRSGEGTEQINQRPTDENAPIALKLSHLKVKMPGEAVVDVNLTVRKGEILGIGGLAGQGKVGIPNGVMGIYPAEGQTELFGEALPLNDASTALHKGLAMVSEDRRGVGLLLEESIEDNIVFNAMQINGRFLRPMLPDCTKLRKSWPKLLLILLLTAACLAFGFYGDSQWPGAAGTPAVVEETTDEAALPEEVLEDVALDEEIIVDDSVPVVARVSPLFLILGFVGVASLAYIALYPLIHRYTDRIVVKDDKAARAYANQMIQELDIRCRGPQQLSGTLSGGNQQKVCIARALALNPQFLFVSEPTRGIDVGAKRLVLETLIRLNREAGMTIVMVSSELLELRSICDRIAIVSDGEVVDIFPADAPDVDIGLAMSGIKAEGQKGGATS